MSAMRYVFDLEMPPVDLGETGDHLVLILRDEGFQAFGVEGVEVAARAIPGADAQAEGEADGTLLHAPPAVEVVHDRQGARLDADEADRRPGIPGQRLLIGDRDALAPRAVPE